MVSPARKIVTVMREEKITLPGGPTYIPPEYVGFFSPDDNTEWIGIKRRALRAGALSRALDGSLKSPSIISSG